jgi:hypothetical protein
VRLGLKLGLGVGGSGVIPVAGDPNVERPVPIGVVIDTTNGGTWLCNGVTCEPLESVTWDDNTQTTFSTGEPETWGAL